LIPVIIAVTLVLIFVEKEDVESSWQMLSWFALISLGVSFPFFLIFSIVYVVCIFQKRSNKFTKRALHTTNLLSIFTSVIVFGWSFYIEIARAILIGSLVLLIPSTLLIICIKIPQKQELLPD